MASLDRDEYLGLVEEALRANLREGEFKDDVWAAFRERIHYVQADALDHDDWGALVEILRTSEDRIRVAYYWRRRRPCSDRSRRACARTV